MDTKNTNRSTAAMVAALLAVVTNWAMLLNFNTVANDATMAHSGQTPAVVTLDTVTIVAHRA